MTSRRLRRLRREKSLPALLAGRRLDNLVNAFAGGAVLSDEQISQLLADGELWRDAAHWSPDLLEES